MHNTFNASRAEEKANFLTHGLGFLLSLAGLWWLNTELQDDPDPWRQAAFWIYGCTVMLLFAASTLYHAARDPQTKQKLRRVDHIAIYFLIAGTYTPFLLISLRDSWGIIMLVIIWALALLGTLFKLKFTGKYPKLSTGFYLGMGWLAVIAAKPMITLVPWPSLVWLVVGGLLYSLGVIFYNWRSLRFHHAIWHVFVLTASACHYIAIGAYL
jgi:hemolysin III